MENNKSEKKISKQLCCEKCNSKTLSHPMSPDSCSNLSCQCHISLTNEIPMGVSKWKQYGLKYGYWAFFENEVRNDTKQRIITAIILLTVFTIAQIFVFFWFNSLIGK